MSEQEFKEIFKELEGQFGYFKINSYLCSGKYR